MFFIYNYSDIGESVKIELKKEDSILLKFIKEDNVSSIQFVYIYENVLPYTFLIKL